MPAFIIALAIGVSAGALPQLAYADDAAVASAQLSRKISQHLIIKGRFEQWRNLTGIPHPIRSSGRFIYWRDHGLYWETRKPISQASTFTPDAILHWQSGTDTRRADKSSSPVQKQISRILLAVFGGDIQSLEKLFDSHWNTGPTPEAGQWTVDLIPTMLAVQQVVKKITLSGRDYVNNLNLDASNGDSTRIRFTDISAFAHPAADDCAYFELDTSSCPDNDTNALPSNQRKP